jgi:aryl-alcohol dehydrogenase-like predicted oxidoreductase
LGLALYYLPEDFVIVERVVELAKKQYASTPKTKTKQKQTKQKQNKNKTKAKQKQSKNKTKIKSIASPDALLSLCLPSSGKTPSQIALAWVLSKKGVVSPIIGTSGVASPARA